jgi:hypothetical protein
VDRITMIIKKSHEEAGEEELIQQAIEKLQSIVTLGDRSVPACSHGHSSESDRV